MTQQDVSQGDDFTDLAAYKKVSMPGVRSDDNVIKSVLVVHSGVEEIHRDTEEAGTPDIVVHRDGEIVVGIDFVCKCGHSAGIRFAYDEE